MPTKLTGLRFSELSLVDEPANKGATVSLYKRDDSAPDPASAPSGGTQPSDNPSTTPGQEDIMTKQTGTDLEAQVTAITKAVESAGGKIEKTDDGNFSVAFNALDTLLAELSKKGVKVEKAETGKPEIEVAKAEPEEMIDFGGEKIAKSALDPAVLKGIEADRARIARLEKAAEDQALAKRAEAELPNIVGTPAVKGAILKAVDAIDDEETRKAAQQALKAANETYEALGKAVGRTTRDTEADTPLAKLNAKAEELRKADSTLSQSAAFTKACEQHPDLYNAHARGGAA